MRQILCDLCTEPIDPETVIGDEVITFVGIATCNREDTYWKEFHRRCARTLTVAAVWKRKGLIPL